MPTAHRRNRGSSVLCAGVFALLAPAFAAAQPSDPPAAAPVPTAQPPDRPAFFEEPRLLRDAMARVEKFAGDGRDGGKDGFYPELGHMITGAGWISAGPGYRRHLFDGRALMDASAAISWRAYKIAQARFEVPELADERLTVGSQVFWQDFTQVRYFGTGPESDVDLASDFRVKATDVVGYASWALRPQLTLRGTGGWLQSPSILPSAGTFERKEPDTMTLHPDAAGILLEEQPSFLHGDVALVFDSRDHAGYPSSGGLYRASLASYRDRREGLFTFDRVELEAARFIPMAGERSVLAVHWWTVLSHTGDGAEVPFYLLPSLGGHNTLRGYDDYRFHDRHLMVVNVESRWALFPHVDGAVFFDAGNVAPRVGDLDFGRRSVGVGLRLHSSRSTLGRFDVGHSDEGWRVMFKLSDALGFGRLKRRTAAVPFVP
jgi:hypothetical protein